MLKYIVQNFSRSNKIDKEVISKIGDKKINFVQKSITEWNLYKGQSLSWWYMPPIPSLMVKVGRS